MTESINSANIDAPETTWLGTAFGVWGIVGFLLLLIRGLLRMVPIAVETLNHPLTWIQISLMAFFFIAFSVGKGYFLFQRSYAPRFARRVRSLQQNPHLLNGVLAPLYCMGLVGHPWKKQLRSWMMVAFVVVMIISSRSLPFPWRGTILGGVCISLVWGALAAAYFGFKALFSSDQT